MTEKRSFFDWIIFLLIHIVLIGGISVVGFYVYTPWLGVWVAVSATVAGFASAYLFHKDVPGEVPMKCLLYICVVLNAGLLAHNGARRIGVESYNSQQTEKFNKAMEEAGKAARWRVARELRLGAENATKLEKLFSDGMSVWVAIFAGAELGMALIIFALSSKRQHAPIVPQVGQGTRVLNPVAMPLARDLQYRRRVPGMAPAQAKSEAEPEGKDHRR